MNEWNSIWKYSSSFWGGRQWRGHASQKKKKKNEQICTLTHHAEKHGPLPCTATLLLQLLTESLTAAAWVIWPKRRMPLKVGGYGQHWAPQLSSMAAIVFRCAPPWPLPRQQSPASSKHKGTNSVTCPLPAFLPAIWALPVGAGGLTDQPLWMRCGGQTTTRIPATGFRMNRSCWGSPMRPYGIAHGINI